MSFKKSCLVPLLLCISSQAFAVACTNIKVINTANTPYVLWVTLGSCVRHYKHVNSSNIWLLGGPQGNVLTFPQLSGEASCTDHENQMHFIVLAQGISSGPLQWIGDVKYVFHPNATQSFSVSQVHAQSAHISVKGNPFKYIQMSYHQMANCNVGNYNYGH